MNSMKAIIFLAMTSLLLAGCMTRGVERVAPYDQVDVFGIQMMSADDYRMLNGVEAVEET